MLRANLKKPSPILKSQRGVFSRHCGTIATSGLGWITPIVILVHVCAQLLPYKITSTGLGAGASICGPCGKKTRAVHPFRASPRQLASIAQRCGSSSRHRTKFELPFLFCNPKLRIVVSFKPSNRICDPFQPVPYTEIFKNRTHSHIFRFTE